MAAGLKSVHREEIVARRRKGESIRLIAGSLGVSASTVRYHAKDVIVQGGATRTCYDLRRVPEPIAHSNDLAYFWGVFAGDGSLSVTSRAFKLGVSCDARYPDLIANYTTLLSNLLGKPAKVSWRGTYAEVYLYGKHLPALLQLPTGDKAHNGFSVPEWIFEREEYVRLFLRGLIETDGGIYHEYRNGGWCSRCLFTAKHEPILNAFLRGMTQLGYEFRRKGIEARFTRTAQVKQLALELDISKQRTYIQKRAKNRRDVAQLG